VVAALISLPVVLSNNAIWLSVVDAGPTTSPEPDGVDQDNVPEPLVVKTWLDVPSADGSVQVTLDATVPGDLKAT
jgi:hypothetical protein